MEKLLKHLLMPVDKWPNRDEKTSHCIYSSNQQASTFLCLVPLFHKHERKKPILQSLVRNEWMQFQLLSIQYMSGRNTNEAHIQLIICIYFTTYSIVNWVCISVSISPMGQICTVEMISLLCLRACFLIMSLFPLSSFPVSPKPRFSISNKAIIFYPWETGKNIFPLRSS